MLNNSIIETNSKNSIGGDPIGTYVHGIIGEFAQNEFDKFVIPTKASCQNPFVVSLSVLLTIKIRSFLMSAIISNRRCHRHRQIPVPALLPVNQFFVDLAQFGLRLFVSPLIYFTVEGDQTVDLILHVAEL